MRRYDVKGAEKDLQALVNGGMMEFFAGKTEEEVNATIDLILSEMCPDKLAVVKRYDTPTIVHGIFASQKYGVSLYVAVSVCGKYGDDSKAIFEEVMGLTEEDETEVREGALALFIRYGWPLEILAPAVRKFGIEKAPILIESSKSSPSGIAQKALELYDRTAKEGARGEKYPTYGRLPPTPRGGTPSDLSNLGYGTHRDNVTGDAPNSVHFLEELVKMNEQAQR